VETITSIHNTKVKHWLKLQTKKGREAEKSFLAEGLHLVEEAIRAKAEIRSLIIQEGIATPPFLAAYINEHADKCCYVSNTVMGKIAETDNPQGICVEIGMVQGIIESMVEKAKFLLLLDALQDPGNMGTILRTAEAAGIDGVIIGKGSVDVYNGKTIRSTMGALFHLPIYQANLLTVIPHLQAKGIRLIATNLEGAVSYDEQIYDGAIAIVIGNEANGVSPAVLEQAAKNVKIPIYGEAESLNAAIAAGIILYEAVRQRKHIACGV
jgi:RNA methyltransferase, TrmH family